MNYIYLPRSIDHQWQKMFFLSLFLHIAVLSIIMFALRPGTSSRIKRIVYEVDLVEMQGVGRSGAVGSYGTGSGIGLPLPKKASSARRIGDLEDGESPLVINKKGLKIKSESVKTSATSSSKRIDEELSKIKSKVEDKKEGKSNKTASPDERKAGVGSTNGSESGNAKDGINVRVYKIEVRDWIKSKWAYPVALSSYKTGEDLVAIILLKVKNDGTILESKFKKRSMNAIFDKSVVNAVERSNPLPPFPEEYRRRHDEIEVTFNLRELETN